MSQICAGHKVSAANDVWCLDFARTPAESLKVYSQNSLIITVDRARFMYWQTCQTFNPQSQSNVMRIHRWLMPEHTFIANELRGTCVGLRGASIDLGGRGEGRRREHLIGALFLGDQHLSSPAVHRPPSTPPSPRHRSLFPRKPGGRGGEGSVMNERHWRTPKAAISDPPPTTEHGQRDNKREREGKKKA